MPLTPASIIACKRDGLELTDDQISAFVDGFSRGKMPDYQMSALAMAIYLQGMSAAETAALTRQMLASGKTLHWSSTGTPKVDKHSTGGVGDKVSLVLTPLLACSGLQVPMLSGRGLGPTAGTLDKLESINGFRTDLTIEEIQQLTEQIGCVITGASPELVPADQKLYALRDVTATVSSIPLITASIMSKKLAENLDALVLDVKFGSGAFMKTREQAKELAESLVSVGEQMQLPSCALLSDMNQPLGTMIGHAVEVEEAVDSLKNAGPADLRELTLHLGAELLVQTGLATSVAAAQTTLQGYLSGGQAYEKFCAMVVAQGGNLETRRKVAPEIEITAPESGYVQGMDAGCMGHVLTQLGGGRQCQTDRIDHSVGLQMLVRLGDLVERGQPLVRLFATGAQREPATSVVQKAITIGPNQPTQPQLVAERIIGTT